MKKTFAIISIILMLAVSAYAKPWISKNGGGGVGSGDVATDTIFDAKGDIVVGTGSNTSDNLAIGTAYQILHVNSDTPGWTSTLGATGTRLTAGYFADLTVTNAIAGSVTGNAGTATALAADPADCAAGQVATGIAASGALSCTATPSVTTLTGAVTGTASGNIPNTLADAKGDLIVASADNTFGKLAVGATNTLLYVNSDTPAWLALGAANTVLTSNGSALAWASTHSHSDSAAQFYSATASKGTLKFDQTGISDTKTVTVKYTATDSYTYTPTFTGNTGVTFPTSGTLAILGGNTFTGVHNFSGATLQLPTGNADPTATAGFIRHDSTVSNHANGAVRWHDGTNIRQVVDMVAATVEACTDDQVVAYDADNDLFYCKDDANSGSATALDDVADPDAATSIGLDNDEGITITSAEDTGTILLIKSSDDDLSDVTSIIDLSFNDDGSANGYYMRGYDHAYTDLKWSIGADGAIVTTGTITSNGLLPDAADGAALGSATAEWSDLYLADGGVIYGQNDQSATLTSSASLWTANNFSVTTQFKLPSTDADPTATAGYLRHDSSNTSASGGGLLAWHDGTNIRQVVDTGTTFTQITKFEYLPIRYAEDDVSVAAPAAAAEIGTTSLIGRSFAEDADNGVIFFWQIPSDYVSGIKYRVFYALNANGQADETAAFALSGCAVGNSEALACTEGTAVVVTDELGTDDDTGELLVTGWSTAVTIGDTPVAGEMASLLLIRDVSEDDYSDHLLVSGIEIKYVGKLNPFSDY